MRDTERVNEVGQRGSWVGYCREQRFDLHDFFPHAFGIYVTEGEGGEKAKGGERGNTYLETYNMDMKQWEVQQFGLDRLPFPEFGHKFAVGAFELLAPKLKGAGFSLLMLLQRMMMKMLMLMSMMKCRVGFQYVSRLLGRMYECLELRLDLHHIWIGAIQRYRFMDRWTSRSREQRQRRRLTRWQRTPATAATAGAHILPYRKRKRQTSAESFCLQRKKKKSVKENKGQCQERKKW